MSFEKRPFYASGVIGVVGLAGALLIASSPLVAQTTQTKPGCETARATEAPTETAKGPDSGTKNMGSTGWSGGGMGGSHNDTTQAGPTPGSKTEHPATAQGLDPTKPDTGKQAVNTQAPC